MLRVLLGLSCRGFRWARYRRGERGIDRVSSAVRIEPRCLEVCIKARMGPRELLVS